jgi:peptide/nickel transport system permease protein
MMATRETSLQKMLNTELPPLVKRILSNKRIIIGLYFLTPMVLMAVLGDIVAPYDPTAVHVTDRYAGPGVTYLLGTDHLGRDLLSRVILGSRTSLLLGFASTAIAVGLGVPIGLLAGYAKGRTDEALMRLMDILMSVPTLLFGLLIVVALPPDVVNLIIAIGVVFGPRIARVTRSATLSVSEEPYVMAAQARGESRVSILFREILPNVTSPIVVEASVRVGYAIMIGAALSFLGLGAGPPFPDWGYMIGAAREHIYRTPWFLIWPSLTLMLTVLSTNLIGDGLRDVLGHGEGGEQL